MTGRLIPLLLASAGFLAAPPAAADVPLVGGEWSTTFECDDWTYPPDAADTACDGLTRSVDSLAYSSRITADANRADGDGGKGFSWLVGNGDVETTSPTSSNLAIVWEGSEHFWLRWYVRFPQGLSIGIHGPNIYGWKVLYLFDPAGDESVYINANYWEGGMDMWDRTNHVVGQYGYSDAIGSETADGSWVAVEMEFDIPNSTWRYWFYVDGEDDPVPKFESTSVSYRMSEIGRINFPSNIRSSGIANAPVSIDFDDLALSVNGRIGPVGGAGGDTGSGDTGGGSGTSGGVTSSDDGGGQTGGSQSDSGDATSPGGGASSAGTGAGPGSVETTGGSPAGSSGSSSPPQDDTGGDGCCVGGSGGSPIALGLLALCIAARRRRD